MKKCPEAFQEEGSDNAQLFLDSLDYNTFEEANEYFVSYGRMVKQMNE
jgi:hypothetical protein